jgi:hypothetical protein
MAPDSLSARPGSARTGDPVASVRSAKKGPFRKQGEYWTVGYDGKSFRLRTARDSGSLAHLRRPRGRIPRARSGGRIASQRYDDETIQKELKG